MFENRSNLEKNKTKEEKLLSHRDLVNMIASFKKKIKINDNLAN